MNLLSLSLSYIRARITTSVLLIFLLALGVATVSLLLHVGHQAQQRMERDARGFDLVVGAKGSPLQLILSSIYHMDIPTGNIPLKEAEQLKKHPQVKQAIPLALGDSYRGFRIVGTETSYAEHYKAELAQGENFEQSMEAVIGATVAQRSGFKLADSFVGSHGLLEGGEEHSDSPYRVVGILKPTGTVIDRLILTPISSVWAVHSAHSHHHHDHDEDEDHDEYEKHEEVSNEITALLISFRSPVAAMSLPREINRMTSMQAASPAFETARLLSLLGLGLDTLRVFGLILIVSAIVGMLVAIYQSMQERKIDLPLMRVLGATRPKLIKLVITETGLLLSLGIVLGLLVSHCAMALLPMFMSSLKDFGFAPFHLLVEEVYLFAGLWMAGIIVALLPAYSAYRVDVSRILARS